MTASEAQSPDTQTVVVSVGPTLDFRNAADFQRTCLEQIRRGRSHIILNFTGTRMLDAAGLRTILLIHRQLAAAEGTLVLSCTSGTVDFATRLTRLRRYLPHFPSVAAALRGTRPLETKLRRRAEDLGVQ